ncbi:MAG: glycosyltransferase family 4 protein [Planctomycetota bacterium]
MSVKKTVAIFCYQDPGSAVGRFALESARLLAGRGHLVHVFSRLVAECTEPGVVTHVVGDGGESDLIGRVRSYTLRACAKFNADLPADIIAPALVGCEWSSIPVLEILSASRKLSALLCLQTMERQRSDMRTSLSRQIEALEIQGIQLATHVLVAGGFAVESARRLVPDCATKITAFADVFPVASFQKPLDAGAIKARFQIGPVDPTLLCIGVLDEDHGADLLIKAVPAVLKKNKQARFIFVGDGPLFWTLRIYSRYLNLDHAVRVVGHMEGDALNELIQAADVIVAPSRRQTERWPILAGWSAGKAVVASHETAAELIEHEQNGVLIYPLADSCSWAVERIFSDPFLWGRIRDNGKLKVTGEFSESARANQLENMVSGL